MLFNATLATYSNMAFGTAVVLYCLTMLLYFGEFAYRAPRTQARRPEAELVTVGASAGTEVPDEPVADQADPPQRRPLTERLGGMAVAMTVLAVVMHGASLVLRGLAVGRAPWGNMYEFGSSICFAAVVGWLIVLFRQSRVARDASPRQLRGLGGFVLLPVVVLLGLCGTLLYTEAGPLSAPLHSYWLWIHVSAMGISCGVLIFAGVASALYLVRIRNENNPLKFARLGSRLPTSQALDRLAYRTTVFIVPVYTFAIIAGAIWAESAWGRFWGWDPKETTALVAWVFYAAYLHARATAGWRGTRAAWINILGFVAIVFNLFFINLVVTGLHSYAGVPGM